MNHQTNEVCDENSEEAPASAEPSDVQINDDLKFLKTVVVSEKTTDTIKLKLSSTANHRKEVVKIENLDFLEHFPIFFTNPEFVSIALWKSCFSVLNSNCLNVPIFKQISYDFAVQFSEADANGFMIEWPNKYGPDIKNMLNDCYGTKISTGWASDIEEILALLKILPAKAGKKSPVVPFIKVIDKLIFHSEVRW